MDQETLKEAVNYDPKTGIFTWRNRPPSHFQSEKRCRYWNSRYAGKEAGWLTRRKNGYTVLSIDMFGRKHRAHRLAWVYMTGETAPSIIDHINRDATDNRWENLRDGTGLNSLNRSMDSRNTSGETGVQYVPHLDKWKSVVHVNLLGKSISVYLGVYERKADAAEMSTAFRRLTGYEEGHGKPRPMRAASK